jgi:hypothetical protein
MDDRTNVSATPVNVTHRTAPVEPAGIAKAGPALRSGPVS